jgi:very-short-patch-repair endonuclease
VTPQHQIRQFRVDFAVVERRLVVELDGHDYHSTKEQRGADASRDRILTGWGWTVLRYTGSEIHSDVHACVGEVAQIALRCEIHESQSAKTES